MKGHEERERRIGGEEKIVVEDDSAVLVYSGSQNLLINTQANEHYSGPG
jgi:hypothetical protein